MSPRSVPGREHVFSLPCGLLYPAPPLLTAPRPHADPALSTANRGRCRVSSSWDAEQHSHMPQMQWGQSKPCIRSNFLWIFSCACFRKQLSNDTTYFPSIPSRTCNTTTDRTTHPKIQLPLSLPVLLGRCCITARVTNAQPGSQIPVLRSTHMGAGVEEHSPGGCINLLLEKHESQLGSQPQWRVHSTFKGLFYYH